MSLFLLRTVTLAIVLVGIAASAAEAEDCMKVIDEGIVREFSQYCEPTTSNSDKFPGNMEQQLQVAEMCACKLIRHPIMWQNMMSDPLVVLEQSGEKVVGAGRSQGDGTNMVDDARLAIRRYQFVAAGPSEDFKKQVENILIDANNGLIVGREKKLPIRVFQGVIRDECKRLRVQFSPYYKRIEIVQNLATNPNAGLRLALMGSDQGLFKVLFTYRLCELADTIGDIYPQYREPYSTH